MAQRPSYIMHWFGKNVLYIKQLKSNIKMAYYLLIFLQNKVKKAKRKEKKAADQEKKENETKEGEQVVEEENKKRQRETDQKEENEPNKRQTVIKSPFILSVYY
jgi:protein subunit release factor B